MPSLGRIVLPVVLINLFDMAPVRLRFVSVLFKGVTCHRSNVTAGAALCEQRLAT
jgi:hypothetical protein